MCNLSFCRSQKGIGREQTRAQARLFKATSPQGTLLPRIQKAWSLLSTQNGRDAQTLPCLSVSLN